MIQFDEHIFQMGWNNQLECIQLLQEAQPKWLTPKSMMILSKFPARIILWSSESSSICVLFPHLCIIFKEVSFESTKQARGMIPLFKGFLYFPLFESLRKKHDFMGSWVQPTSMCFDQTEKQRGDTMRCLFGLWQLGPFGMELPVWIEAQLPFGDVLQKMGLSLEGSKWCWCCCCWWCCCCCWCCFLKVPRDSQDEYTPHCASQLSGNGSQLLL